MQLSEQMDMFDDITRGRRYWAVRSADEADGHWVCVTEGNAVPDDAAIEAKLGFAPTMITEISEYQAKKYKRIP
jgi:hypothetical protein